jgi:nucleoside-diphosphate-sugar epimerase
MRVLVVGGTGYVGRRLLEKLLEAGHEVAAVSRGNLAPSALEHVRHFALDRNDRESFEAAFQHETFDAVIDNIVFAREDVESAARAFGGRTAQYAITSTMAVYHDATALDPLVESDADLTFHPEPFDTRYAAYHPTQGHAYGNGKRQAELALQALGNDVFAFTSLRAPIVVGPDDRTRRIWWFVQRLLDGGPIILPDWGPGRLFQVVTADDLARAFVTVIGNTQTFGKSYNVAQSEIFTAETWVQALARPLGVTATTVRIAEDTIPAAGLTGYNLPIAGRPFGQFLMDTSALRHDTGLEWTPGEEWLKDTSAGCAANPMTVPSQGYDQREQEVALARKALALLADVDAKLRV